MQRWAILSIALNGLGWLGCANPGLPAYETSRPKPLPSVGEPRDATSVRIATKPLPWWTVAGEANQFILGFDEQPATNLVGTRIGAVRSRDIELADHIFAAVRCAWQVVPMGDPRWCPEMTRTEAMAIARDAITEARAELRAHAADAGAGAVVEVRCFAQRDRLAIDDEPGASHLWCEGIALTTPDPAGAAIAAIAPDPAAATVDTDPAAPIDHEPRLTETRLVLLADGSVGMLGKRVIVGSTLALRYRPIEVGFYILDLQRDSLAPRDDGLVGIGITALGRFALGRSRADAIVGVSSVAAAVNNTTNPRFEGLYHGFAGLAYQTPWRIAGAAQPFVQLRAGAAAGGVVSSISGTRAVPMLELHLGLSSPERR